jgi:gas vesicle protein
MKTYGKVLLAVGCGIAAGAIAGILFAPDKGSNTRRKISETAEEYANRMRTIKDSLTGKVKVAHNGHSRKTKVEEGSLN